ncbi:Cof-type HAD-IIB family hydrolase [Paenibacillus abyssi]|uniref:Cof-type HAD-IIB family hydrolase n=1 Tax=Paenibacillus abyssi TaxID=1340531 RepID=UPI001669858D|nr:Cof-type HAD-IIB family hydrolase [Paenibacillus abyssi]
MNKKLIFFDIDGTLLDHDKNLPSSTKQAVFELVRAGHEVAIATGRAPFMFEDLRKELGIDTFVSLNGQYAVSQGEVIYRNPIATELLLDVTDFAASNDHPIVYMDKNGMRSNVPHHHHIESSLGTINITLPVHDPEYYLTNEIYQAMVFCGAAEEGLYHESFDRLRFVRWHPFSMDVMPANGSKANGIAYVMNGLGVGIEDVYAFGDNLNDLEMLQFVGHGISMGNAPEVVKKSARYITKNVHEDGIFFGLRMVGLL